MSHISHGSEEIYETFVEDKSPEDYSTVKVETKESVNIESTHIVPSTAFEYFHGKIYEHNQDHGMRHIYSLADSVERRVESPLQRLARLRAEAEDLRSDLAAMEKEQEASKAAPEVSLWSTLQSETKGLLSGLEGLATKAEQLQQRQMNSKSAAGEAIEAAVEKLSLSEKSQTGNGVDSDGVVSKGSVTDLVALERRVDALETLLGSASNALDMEGVLGVSASGRTYPLVDSLANLERRVNMLDEAAMEGIKNKAVALRSELEEVQKDRIRQGGSAQRVIDSARKVEAIYDRVNQVKSVSEDLPALVLRLKTLESIHHEAASFTSRLSDLENSTVNLEAEMDANASVLKALKESLAENMETMKGNIEQIDSRINRLTES